MQRIPCHRSEPEAHYDIRYICHRTGNHYCVDHSHEDACCVRLPHEFVSEGEGMIFVPEEEIEVDLPVERKESP